VRACGINNPKQIYFLSQEVGHVSAERLAKSIVVLFELQCAIKQGQVKDLEVSLVAMLDF
jgi:DNA polymerase III subunit delta